MRLTEIVTRINKFATYSLPFKDETVNIQTYAFIQKEQTYYIPGCLYIGTVSELPPIPPNMNVIFLCIEDIALPRLYLEATHLNLCCIANSEITQHEILDHVSVIINEDVNFSWNLQKLFDAVYSNLGLQSLIDTATEIFGHPMLLHDTSFKILAFSDEAKNIIGIIEDKNGDKYIDAKTISFIRDNHIYSKIRNHGYSVYVKKSEQYNGTLVAIIHIHGIEVAQLAIYEAGKQFQEIDFKLIKHFRKILSIELQKNDFFSINKNLLPNYFLTDLLDKRISDEDSVKRRLDYLKWPETTAYQIMVINNGTGNEFESKVPFIIRSLQSFIPSHQCIVYKNELVVFIDDTIRHILLDVSNSEFVEYLKANSLFAGISIQFARLSESRKYYSQALKAYELAQRKNIYFCLYEKCTLYFLTELISSQSDIVDFCHPSIIQLAKEEKDNGTPFLETLKYYLYHTHSPNDAAKALCIHRNTLFYRINKIKQLTGVTLNNADERFQLYLSILLLEFNNISPSSLSKR
ncbi:MULTISPECIES: PucR family transcriptional regulator [Dehalobacter]|uniref:PucR C-terminal helix-turn-helix domain-containing protein n=1 Tax=Dehalobacter restrictus TaxID=55583 RepID=A0A857DHE2_9FIRM|nr:MULTISPECIES: helix-turn-helix domain-containing protein [Dehalobacter]MCG1025880.1 helix-turn-helix domain-containing protein [Dehalobacter sp.]OCZ52095.1 hypothetical protein A7D23_11670 [Dehalobacter sp. TeCB1]QGZ99928.1 hypothetical protein GQ588_04345 [Dehalobacter restrictus]